MNLFVAIASPGDLRGFNRYKAEEWASNVIVISPHQTLVVMCESALKKASSTNAVLLVLTPAICRQSPDAVLNLLSDEELKPRIFIHPSLGNRPAKREVSASLGELLPSCAQLEKIKNRSVAFSIGGEDAFRIQKLQDVWEWLCGHPDQDPPAAPCPSAADLNAAHERLWRRDNLQSLVELVLYAQGIVSPEVSTEQKQKWMEDLAYCLDEGEEQWVKEVEELRTVTEELSAAVKTPSAEKAIQSASDAFVKMVRQFASDLTLEASREY